MLHNHFFYVIQLCFTTIFFKNYFSRKKLSNYISVIYAYCVIP